MKDAQQEYKTLTGQQKSQKAKAKASESKYYKDKKSLDALADACKNAIPKKNANLNSAKCAAFKAKGKSRAAAMMQVENSWPSWPKINVPFFGRRRATKTQKPVFKKLAQMKKKKGRKSQTDYKKSAQAYKDFKNRIKGA